MNNNVEKGKRKVESRLRQFACLFPLSFFLLFSSCVGDRCRTPFGEGGELDLLQPDFISLYNNPGETLVINRGYRGILVHCINLYDYVAFECACPHCLDVGMMPDDFHRASILTCPECGSRFDVYFGNPLEGSLTGCMLFQYNTYYDGRFLSIY